MFWFAWVYEGQGNANAFFPPWRSLCFMISKNKNCILKHIFPCYEYFHLLFVLLGVSVATLQICISYVCKFNRIRMIPNSQTGFGDRKNHALFVKPITPKNASL